MFEVNDIPPIDGWELQQLIAENVQHEEFLFFRFYAGDEQDYFGPDSYTKRYECFCTACRAVYRAAFPPDRPANGECARAAAGRYAQTVMLLHGLPGTEPHSAGPASKWRMCPRWRCPNAKHHLPPLSFAFSLFSGRRARRAVLTPVRCG